MGAGMSSTTEQETTTVRLGGTEIGHVYKYGYPHAPIWGWKATLYRPNYHGRLVHGGDCRNAEDAAAELTAAVLRSMVRELRAVQHEVRTDDGSFDIPIYYCPKG
jgi:hypothetical protein